jgi:hypothetical protein
MKTIILPLILVTTVAITKINSSKSKGVTKDEKASCSQQELKTLCSGENNTSSIIDLKKVGFGEALLFQ